MELFLIVVGLVAANMVWAVGREIWRRYNLPPLFRVIPHTPYVDSSQKTVCSDLAIESWHRENVREAFDSVTSKQAGT
ncbi:hypothetical protein [Rubrimonas cliftonensis]|uniref:hypothetical protein n=1 Tax=Rubrimonas cliftonensis TaxID=89524 RepID=UPI001114FA5C|nr:hypothetical protein [Rubrimonas cliftonensis]